MSILGSLANKLKLPVRWQLSQSSGGSRPENTLRRAIAAHYLQGEGLEIGALHAPLEVPPTVKVLYVDRMSVSQLREQYQELADYDLVEIDIIDNGESLASVSASSMDFIIANHMIEHCQDPITAICNWLRVLKVGGILYMAVPDKRHTFDQDRPVTTLDHLIRDHHEGPQCSRQEHFAEWVRLVDKVAEDKVAGRLQQLLEIDYSIHFHVWTQTDFLELLLYCQRQLNFPYEIELVQQNSFEFITVLRKTAANG